MRVPDGQDPQTPFPGFAFFVAFQQAEGGGAFGVFEDVPEPITGGFSEVTGLEATMEAKVIKEGGRNYGPVQRAGPTSFSTVVLKRGVVASRQLWAWWSLFAGADDAPNGGWALRLSASQACQSAICLSSPMRLEIRRTTSCRAM